METLRRIDLSNKTLPSPRMSYYIYTDFGVYKDMLPTNKNDSHTYVFFNSTSKFVELTPLIKNSIRGSKKFSL